MIMTTDTEIYPMPMFNRLVVSDLKGSTEWYQNALGFETVFAMDGIAHLRYRKYGDILLLPSSEVIDPECQGRGVSISFNVKDETIAELTDRARKAGVTIERGPTETPYNTREIIITDPDGYQLVFSESVDITRNFEEVIGVNYDEVMDQHE
jgi:lactoylglutathione lyase